MEDYIRSIKNKNVYIINSKDIYYFEDLRASLIAEVNRFIIENREDKEELESGLKLLEKVYNNNFGYEESFVINELEQFGYSIMKLKDLQDNLLTLKHYFKFNGSADIENTNKNDVDKVLEDIRNYFKD